MFRKAAFFWIICAFIAPAALASSGASGLSLTAHGYQSSNGTVDIYLAVGSPYGVPGPGVQVAMTPCAIGQQTPFHVRQTRHLGANSGEALYIDKAGELVWSMTSLYAYQPKFLRLPFVLAHNKGGPSFCVRVMAYDIPNAQVVVREVVVDLH